MGGTTVPKKLYYRIGEACRAVDIQPYVLRYWETEFDALAPGKSKSGQRVYTEQELGVIRRIKELLYEEGYTIAGAKKRLQAELDEGRVFGSPEVEGELFEEGGGEGDEVPAIPVEPGSGAERDERDEAGAAADAERSTEGWRSATEAQGDSELERGEESAPAADSGLVVERAGILELVPDPEPAASLEAAPVAEADSAPAVVAPRRSRGRSKRTLEAVEKVTAVTDDAAESAAESVAETDASAVAFAASAAETQPTAVDSALSERVETLEHGLRRVLAEVRHLRDLLAEPGSGR